MTPRERVLAILAGKEPDRVPFMPITMMVAADHAGVPYRKYVTDFNALVEGQLRTAETYGIDYVSCISDPVREAADCGAAIRFFDDTPPAPDEGNALLRDKKALAGLKPPDPGGGGRMTDRLRAAALFKKRAGELLIEGWIEGPCAEAADLRGINELMTDFYDDPGFVRDLFEFTTALGIEFARAQVEAGAQLIGIGDAAASLVGPRLYDEFVWPYEKRLVEGVHALGARTRLHICGNTRPILAGMGRLGCDLVDLDWYAPMGEARQKMGPKQALLGNLDPVRTVRDGTPEIVTAAIAECHQQAGFPYIVGAGCEIPRGTPSANLMALRDYARRRRR